ncbi:MAG: response regulator [Rhodothermaceae bacterium]
MAINILIGDDHPAVINGMENYFNNKSDINIAAKCKNGKETIEKYCKLKPDIVILDIYMPVVDGYEAAKEILKVDENAKILFYSVSLKRAEIYQTYKLGGKGFISKERELTVFDNAINIVYKNQLYFDNCFTEEQYKEYDEALMSVRKGRENLTNREKDILPLTARGLTNTQIAQKLDLSVKTIEFHKKNIRRKLGQIDSAEFIKFALEFGE